MIHEGLRGVPRAIFSAYRSETQILLECNGEKTAIRDTCQTDDPSSLSFFAMVHLFSVNGVQRVRHSGFNLRLLPRWGRGLSSHAMVKKRLPA
jgi:hypothetical protein